MGNRDTTSDDLVRAVMGLGRQVAEVLSSGRYGFEASEASRRNLAEKYRAVMEAIPDGYLETDASGKLAFCNQAFCEVVGRPMGELVGSDYCCYVDAKSAQKLRSTCMRIWLTGKSKEIDCEVTRPDGSVRLISTSIA